MANMFFISPQVIANLHRLKDHAERHPFTWDDMFDIYNNAAQPAGLRPGFFCAVPLDFKVVLTIEPTSQGMSRHLSVSRLNKKLPSPYFVEIVMKELGFNYSFDHELTHVYLDEDDTVINVVELLTKK